MANDDAGGGAYYKYNTDDANNANATAQQQDEYWTDSDEGIDLYFVIFLSLLAITLVASKVLHDMPKVAAILPEAGLTIIIGAIAGLIIYESTPISHHNGYNGDDGNDYDDNYQHSNAEFVAEGLLSFSPKVFFFVLLPPIIFNSGYTLKREVFFRHIMPVSLFACAGTMISTFVVAMSLQIIKQLGWFGADFKPYFTELLTFGALISATDPVSTLAVFQAKKVDPQLFYLVFGESVLNDAVGLVLFKTLSKFVGSEDNMETIIHAFLDFLMDFLFGFIGSMIFGILAGLGSALFLKKVDMRHTPTLELSLFVLIMYLPFFFAELFELSGIVTILFTGISARRYASHNLSTETDETVDSLFRLIAHLAETSIFLELGMSVIALSDKFKYEWKFAGWATLACLLGRALHVYPLRQAYNRFLVSTPESENENMMRSHRKIIPENLSGELSEALSMTPNLRKDLKIRDNTAHMLWFSGLRGAVAYACAKTFPNAYGNRPAIVFTTMAIVLFTVFTFGCTTDCALNALKIEMNVDEEKYMEENEVSDKMDYINVFEKKYINSYVIRDYNGTDDDGVELQNISAVGQMGSSTFESSVCASTAGAGRTRFDLRNLSGSQPLAERVGLDRRRSLYDYGLGRKIRREPVRSYNRSNF